MGLIVALDEDGTAQGDLFWDDGDSQGTYYLEYWLSMDCFHDNMVALFIYFIIPSTFN